MFSLQRLLGSGSKFFDLFDASAQAALACAQALGRVLAEPASAAALEDIRQARKRNKAVTEEISELAATTFVTVLEREDIEALAGALYTIPKPIEKFAEHYRMLRDVLGCRVEFRQVPMIEEACATVVEMAASLRDGIDVEKVSKLNAQVQAAEAEADRLELELLRDLYHQQGNPLLVIVVRELYELLEKAIDRCRDAGNVVLHICHKNS